MPGKIRNFGRFITPACSFAALIVSALSCATAWCQIPLSEVRFTVWGSNNHMQYYQSGTSKVSVPLPGPPVGHESHWRFVTGSEVEPAQLGSVYVVPTGLLKTGFILVDDRQGSWLANWVNENVTRLNLRRLNRDAQVSEIYKFLGDTLRPLPEEFVPGRQDLARRNDLMRNSPEFNQKLFNLPVADRPIPMGFAITAYPLDNYIRSKQANCIVRVLLTSLFLKRLGINHFIVQGQTLGSGHTWIRWNYRTSTNSPVESWLVDPTFQWQGRLIPTQGWQGWYQIDRTQVTPYTTFHYLRLN